MTQDLLPVRFLHRRQRLREPAFPQVLSGVRKKSPSGRPAFMLHCSHRKSISSLISCKRWRGNLILLNDRAPYILERRSFAGNAVFSRRGKWAMKEENGTECWTDPYRCPCNAHLSVVLPAPHHPLYLGRRISFYLILLKPSFNASNGVLRLPLVTEVMKDTNNPSSKEASYSLVITS